MITATSKPYVLKASVDSRSLPIELFGSGRSRHQRKLVYNYITTYANPDGTSACPSLTTIAKDNGLSRRGAINVVQWLIAHALLRKDAERSRFNTNDYTCLFSVEDQKRCRAILRAEAARVKPEDLASASQRAPSSDEMVNPNVHHPLVHESTHQGSARQEQMVHDGEVDGAFQGAHDRPDLPSVNRPLPSILPSSKADGGKDGSPTPQTSKNLADNLARTMSDLTYAITAARHIPSVEDCRRIDRVITEMDPAVVVIAFYSFCARPKGVGGLIDLFGMFWREWEFYRGHAEQLLSEGTTVTEVLDDLYGDLYFVREECGVNVHNTVKEFLGLSGLGKVTGNMIHPEFAATDEPQICTENG